MEASGKTVPAVTERGPHWPVEESVIGQGWLGGTIQSHRPSLASPPPAPTPMGQGRGCVLSQPRNLWSSWVSPTGEQGLPSLAFPPALWPLCACVYTHRVGERVPVFVSEAGCQRKTRVCGEAGREGGLCMQVDSKPGQVEAQGQGE